MHTEVIIVIIRNHGTRSEQICDKEYSVGGGQMQDLLQMLRSLSKVQNNKFYSSAFLSRSVFCPLVDSVTAALHLCRSFLHRSIFELLPSQEIKLLYGVSLHIVFPSVEYNVWKKKRLPPASLSDN